MDTEPQSPKPVDPTSLPRDFYNEQDSDNTCFLCGQPRYRPYLTVTHYGFPFTFKQCQCGIIKQTPMPNQKFFDWFFNSDIFFNSKQNVFGKQVKKTGGIWGYYDYFTDEPCRLKTSQYRYHKLRGFLERGTPLNIMKVGPGSGTFLHVAKERGHKVLGCDISSTFAKYAQEHYGVQVDIGPFEKQKYGDGQFNAVLLFNILENVPNQEEFLKEVNRTLSPDGLLIANYVDMKGNFVASLQKQRYSLFRPPICYIYDRDVFRCVLAKIGFEVERTYWDIRYLHAEKILSLLGWHFILKIAKFLRIEHLVFPIWGFPSKIVVARKIGVGSPRV